MNALRLILMHLLAAACIQAGAAPLVPTSDTQVIETLPAAGANRAEERRWRREWATNPADASKAVALSRRYLEQARIDGDPRRAGLALAALKAWPDANKAPDDVLLMVAAIEQYLHDFDVAANHLEHLVRRQPQHAQGWLTLATVRRVQGRYEASDKACEALALAGAAMHSQACRAENDGLRGHFDSARAVLTRLERSPRIDAQTRNWLLTTLAETESRAGRAAQAESAYRSALMARNDAYTNMSYADFLMQQERHADAIEQLKNQPRTDAVLLRLAIAGTHARSPEAARDAREMRERMSLANQRPDARATHAREQAMFALWVDHAPQRALSLARVNVRKQREPLDLLVLAQAARAAGQPAALAEADAIRKEMGLHDHALEALL